MSGRTTSGDGSSRWGPSKRSREDERPSRGYSINDQSKRSRVDDRNRGRRDDNYYGRGYEERSRDDREYSRGYEEQRPRRYSDDEGGYEERGHRYRYPEESEWRCGECGIYNYDCDERCARCGTRQTPRRFRSMSQEDPDEDPDIKLPKGPKWPPSFEDGGAAYDFHAASGMFYEATADFFYDPKTKLYYGNKQKVYYTFRPGQDPPFCALEAPLNSDGVAPASEVAVGPKAEEKKKIAISLKTTVLPGEGEAGKKQKKTNKTPKKATKPAPPPEPKKQDAANIEVWAERGKEVRQEAAASTMNLPMTTNKNPVCLLCRRKFASVEKLKKHEELSTLHKENLEKKKREEETKKEKEAGLEYRDRALERRIMHGPEAVSLPALPRDLDASTAKKTDVVRPEENLGASNIGNQMLQKLGWKSGSSLGRGAANAEGTAHASVQNTLVKDWEKIETLAASGQHGSMKPNSRESGIGN